MFEESTINDLHISTRQAFPATRKRQHSIDEIRIVELKWTPYIGLKTLFVRGRARSEGKVYSPIVVFKDVSYGSGIPLMANDGRRYLLERLSQAENDVLLRCSCKDFYWRFHHYNKLDRSLQGSDRKKYEAKTDREPVNPTESPGMCKHLWKMIAAIRDSGILR